MANATYRYGMKPLGEHYRIEEYLVAVSQTIARWDPLELNTDGTVKIATATSAGLLGSAVSAVTTGAADTTTKLKVYVADAGCQYIMQASGSLTSALDGDYVDIEGTTGAFQLDENASSIKIMQIIRPYTDDGDAEGTNCQAIVKVVVGKSQYMDVETS